MNRYEELLEHVFLASYKSGATRVSFGRPEFDSGADSLGMERIKNLGDIVYSVRYRTELPESIRQKAPQDCEWIIIGAGKGLYEFRLARKAKLAASDPEGRQQIKVLDSTPEVLRKYAPSRDEQALLTRVRYNRIIDIFLGITCYSIQNHYRTSVAGIGQIEVDEIYIGFGRTGAHFVIPCQAKSPGDNFGVVQVYQDLCLCREQYPTAIVRPIGLQFTGPDTVAALELAIEESGDIFSLQIVDERHYRFVRTEDLADGEINLYNKSSF